MTLNQSKRFGFLRIVTLIVVGMLAGYLLLYSLLSICGRYQRADLASLHGVEIGYTWAPIGFLLIRPLVVLLDGRAEFLPVVVFGYMLCSQEQIIRLTKALAGNSHRPFSFDGAMKFEHHICSQRQAPVAVPELERWANSPCHA